MRLMSVSGAQKRNNDKQMRAASGRDSGIGVALAAAAISAALTARLMQWYSGRDQKAGSGVLSNQEAGGGNGNSAAGSPSLDAEQAQVQLLLSAQNSEQAALRQVQKLEEQLRARSTEMTLAAAAATQSQLADAAVAAQSRESIVRELEVQLSGVMAAKTRQEKEMVQRQEAADAAVAAATQGQQESAAELERFKVRAADIQRKVAATGNTVQRMGADLERVQRERDAALEQLEKQSGSSPAAGDELTAIRKQLRQAEGELRTAKETCRRMEDRMRGVLKERSELVSTIRNLSPGKAMSGGGSMDTS